MTSDYITFIVVNWNTKEMTCRCIDSLRASAAAHPHEIILIDNGSTDGSVEHLCAHDRDLVVIANAENRGSSQAINQGLARARGTIAFLVNSDIIANRTTVDALIDFLHTHRTVGVAAVNLVVGSTGKIQYFSFGYRPTIGRIANQFLGLWCLARIMPWFSGMAALPLAGGAPRPVDWVSGAFMAVRMDAYRAVGGWREDFFFYVEDVDWCLRLGDAGWGVYMLPALHVLHFTGASQKKKADRERMICQWYTNLRTLFSERSSARRVVLFDLLAVVGFGMRYIFSMASHFMLRQRAEADLRGDGAVVRLALCNLRRKTAI